MNPLSPPTLPKLSASDHLENKIPSNLLQDSYDEGVEHANEASVEFEEVDSFIPELKVFNLLQEDYVQADHVNKMKQASVRRQARRKTFSHPLFQLNRDCQRMKQAVSAGNIELVEELLMDGVSPCISDDKSRTPLHIAAASGNDKMVQILLDFGANPNQKDLVGNTALHLAACTCNIPVVTLLLQRGTDVNSLDHCGRSPLHLACSRLKLLQGNKLYTSDQLKHEVAEVIRMIRAYLVRSSNDETDNELADLCFRLEKTVTHEEIDAVGELLNDFANLQLQRRLTDTDGRETRGRMAV